MPLYIHLPAFNIKWTYNKTLNVHKHYIQFKIKYFRLKYIIFMVRTFIKHESIVSQEN